MRDSGWFDWSDSKRTVKAEREKSNAVKLRSAIPSR